MARTAAGTLRLPRTITVEAASATDTGLARERNEDALVVDEENGLYAVADGMGGHQAGDVASNLALNVVREEWRDARSRPGWTSSPDDASRALVLAVQRANRRVFDAGRSDLRLLGMGTTFAGVALAGDTVALASCGDTRVYRLRHGNLERLTRDHTMSEELRRAGVVSVQSTTRNMLLRSLGTRQFLAVDSRVERSMPGDVLLICTDGVWDLVDDRAIQRVLESHATLAAKVAELIELALLAGGPDNATCVALRF